MNIKTTTLIEAAGGGFSETFYLVEPSLDAAAEKMENYLSVRLRVLAAGDPDGGEGRCVGYRLSNVDNPRQFLIVPKDFPGTYKGDQQPSGSDMPWTGILLDIHTASNSRRSFTLRGVPDTAIKNTYKGVSFGAFFDKQLQVYRRYLASEEFYIQALDNGGGNPLKTILSATAEPGGVRIVFTAPHNLTNDDHIRLHRCKSFPTISGQHAIVVITPDTILIPAISLGSLTFLSGKARKVLYRYDRIVNVVAVRKAARKAGRPFFLLRGRR